MSEFTKVLDRIHENLENGQPMFDGIEYSLSQGDLHLPKWIQAKAIDDRIDLYRVKPVVTGMFSAESLKDLMWQKGPRDINWSELSDELNAFVESKLPAVREQAVREFINFIATEYPFWPVEWLTGELIKMKGRLAKGPERGEPKPANEQTINLKIPESAAPVIPEQRITIQSGDYVPHELITSEAVFDLVIKAFTETFKAVNYIVEYSSYKIGLSSPAKGLGITSDAEEITNISISAIRPLTLQQLFNATNGFEWPEGTKYITDTCGNVEFSKNFSSMTPGVKVLATRVK